MFNRLLDLRMGSIFMSSHSSRSPYIYRKSVLYAYAESCPLSYLQGKPLRLEELTP